MSRPRFTPDAALKYQRAYQGAYEGALHHWKKFLFMLVAGLTVLYAYEFLAGPNGWWTIQKVARETELMEQENQLLARQVHELKMQDRKLETDDFVLEKTVRENLRMALPGEVLYLFNETPENAYSTAPVEFEDVTVAKRPPKKEPKAPKGH